MQPNEASMHNETCSEYLRTHWEKLTAHLSDDKDDFFQELISLYTSPNRFYHNLNHIQALLKLSENYRHLLKIPITIDFAIWYHDAIYDASKSDNEEKSAELAELHLSKMGVDKQIISDCCELIQATAKHELPEQLNNFDGKFLMDIDLSILAAPGDDYMEYTAQIRKEYSIYADELYRNGRMDALLHFTKTHRIFKTDLFFDLFEKRARKNLSFEIESLG